jgi:demethylmenaquinone methyltransferase/2-methoxy-6-polyprenyl-1,4-benzoquinol methylase
MLTLLRYTLNKTCQFPYTLNSPALHKMNHLSSSPPPPLSEGALEEPGRVQGMFGRIARRYDLANALLSGGMDALWRRRAARIVSRWQPGVLLDLATGSGVLASTLARACPRTRIIGADFCLPMLQQAQRVRHQERLVVADGMRLPFADGAFDALTVAFGLRNMASFAGALREMGRVLKPGGHLLVLDFSLPRGWLRGPYRVYLHRALPVIAGIVSGERGAYEYLAESIERFPSGEAMRSLLAECGFKDARAEELTGGIVSLYTATVEKNHAC